MIAIKIRGIRRLSPVLCLAVLAGCKGPSESEDTLKSDGEITVHVEGPESAGGRIAAIRLHDADGNVYDPALAPVDTLRIILDAAGDGSGTFHQTLPGGTRYRLYGAIDMVPDQNGTPDHGDYRIDRTGITIDGNRRVTVTEADLQPYSMMIGDGSFQEKNLGRHHVRIWHGDDRTGWSRLGWIGDVDQMIYRFNGSGGAIGRVGKKYMGSAGGPKRVDFIDDSPVNVKARIDYTGPGTHLFGIYGWVFNNTTWDNSGIKHEFYVIEHLNRPEYDPLIDTLIVDGVRYEMHKYDFGGGSYRFKAVRAEDMRFSGPINMKPFFDYWRLHGMGNLFLDEMTWAIELIGGRSVGSFTCWDIEIPDY